MCAIFRVSIIMKIVYVPHVKDRYLTVVLGQKRNKRVCVRILENKYLLVALHIRLYFYARLIGSEINAVLVLYIKKFPEVNAVIAFCFNCV